MDRHIRKQKVASIIRKESPVEEPKPKKVKKPEP